MNTRQPYSQFVRSENVEGSNKAPSYIRALELLGPILAKTRKFSDCADVFAVRSVERISDLYEYVLQQQRREDGGVFSGAKPASYWQKGFCSAALKSYREFLILAPYKQRLWDLVERGDDPAALSRRLGKENIESIEHLIPEPGFDFSTREGQDKLREVKARVNQAFFREMILVQYRVQCCVSGLSIPAVLRASHIVSWADDKANRLNPANGLCLSATYDAAFDRHLISFDENCRMIFSPVLKEFYDNKAFQTQFRAFEGQPISMPGRFRPDPAFLSKHREKMPQ